MSRFVIRLWAAIVAVGAVVAVTPSCATLDPLSTGCGNSIVEPALGEDCDGNFDDKVFCRAPATVGACRYDCLDDHACPAGYGCSSQDGICRRASGSFEDRGLLVAGPIDSSFAADFDDDGQVDIATTIGSSLRVHYVDSTQEVDDAVEIPGVLSAPTRGDITGDGALDFQVIAPSGGIGVFRSQTDRRFAPTVYDSEFSDQDITRVIFGKMASEAPFLQDSLLVISDGFIGAVSFSLADGQDDVFFGQNTSLDSIAGFDVGYVAAPDALTPSLCEKLVLAKGGASSVEFLSPCFGIEPNPAPNGPIAPWSVALPPGVSVRTQSIWPDLDTASAVRLVHLNDDSLLDLIVATTQNGQPSYATAYGMPNGHFHSQPTPPEPGPPDDSAGDRGLSFLGTCVNGEPPLQSFPLAVGDFNEDGATDFVFRDAVYLSTAADQAYLPALCVETPIKHAAVADFTGNGVDDIAVANELGVAVLLSSGGGTFSTQTIQAGVDVRQLSADDFDGDLVADIVLSAADEEADTERLFVAWGSTSAEFTELAELGTLNPVHQLVSGRAVADDGLADAWIFTLEDNRLRLALLIGNPARQLQSPFALADSSSPRPHTALAVENGMFDADRRALIAVAARFNPDPLVKEEVVAIVPWFITWEGPAELSAVSGTTEIDVSAFFGPDGAESDLDAQSFRIAAIDLNGDGIEEAVVISPGGLHTLSWKDGEFGPPVVSLFSEPFRFPPFRQPVTVGDVDGDEDDDLIITSASGHATIFWNDQSGSLDVARSTTLVGSPEGMEGGPAAPGATNGLIGSGMLTHVKVSTLVDGESQLLVLGTDAAFLVPVQQDGTLGEASRIVGLPGGNDAAIADFDYDGVLDIALAAGQGLRLFTGIPEIQ